MRAMANLRGMRKILSHATDNVDNVASATSTFLRRAPIVAGAVIGGAGVLDFATNKIGELSEEHRARQELKEEKRDTRKASRSKQTAYATVEEFENYVQSLWDERNKHSRAWGGKIY